MRTRKTLIILISGRAGVGKSTTSEILLSELERISGLELMKYSFSSPIKYMAKSFFGWDGEKDEKGRRLLQDIGKVGREYNINIWVRHLLNQMDRSKSIFPPSVVVIDDWRFPDELDFLKKNISFDIVTIRIFGRGSLDGDIANDLSETSLPESIGEWLSSEYERVEGLGYNYSIDNSEDLELLKSKLETILAEIKKQYIVE